MAFAYRLLLKGLSSVLLASSRATERVSSNPPPLRGQWNEVISPPPETGEEALSICTDDVGV